MTKGLALTELHDLASRALQAAGTSAVNADHVARALVAAEADGLASHGLSRVSFYADQAASGKVDGRVTPVASDAGPAAVRVDAACGFAYPAIDAGLERGLQKLPDAGLVAVVVGNSHHCGVLGHPVERAAAAGAVALGFSNTPSGMAPWGGHLGSFGTNPIAFATPRAADAPLVVDLSLSKVARGKVMVARRQGESIPEGWALDPDGRPTTDPETALAGTMVPAGDAKGAALALMVEILTAGLGDSHFAFEASSFFDAEGPSPRVAQTFLLVDPGPLAGRGFAKRVESLLGHMSAQDGVRIPGERRLALRRAAERDGVEVPESVLDDLRRRAGSGP
jgi:(2R)-3-sulfolactate dehydrogenase (NADP+)